MTTAIMSRPQTPTPEHDPFSRVLSAINSHRTPRCENARPHRAAPAAALGAHLLAVVRAQDATIPAHRRAPRTVAEMRARIAALYEDEQDACGVCGFWQCRCTEARTLTPGPADAVPAPASSGGQCNVCGGWFEDWPGGTCDACR
ncbi:hypothetical protein [Streptomyces collinus]|uniref:Uncharacterized protein n=1 Tax=Streptomyces collinus (strain DSM 40733 / Tue 365) TaxID=1214242 RepID=S5V8L2_STRC3|nr:hypothetical protein [Streptomyces collinus]AGS73876.1 hypothetical protein B446_35588 [Streptomyces collinus Tu 365]